MHHGFPSIEGGGGGQFQTAENGMICLLFHYTSRM